MHPRRGPRNVPWLALLAGLEPKRSDVTGTAIVRQSWIDTRDRLYSAFVKYLSTAYPKHLLHKPFAGGIVLCRHLILMAGNVLSTTALVTG